MMHFPNVKKMLRDELGYELLLKDIEEGKFENVESFLFSLISHLQLVEEHNKELFIEINTILTITKEKRN